MHRNNISESVMRDGAQTTSVLVAIVAGGSAIVTVLLLLSVVVGCGQPSVGSLVQGDNTAGINWGVIGCGKLKDVGEFDSVDGNGSSNDAVLASQVLEKVVLNAVNNRGRRIIESNGVKSTSAEILVWVGATIPVSLLQRVEFFATNTRAGLSREGIVLVRSDNSTSLVDTRVEYKVCCAGVSSEVPFDS